MYRYHPLNTGLAVGLTWGLTYLLCALITSLAPTLLADALSILVHGLNVEAFKQPVPPMSALHIAIGAGFFTAVGLWTGALYAIFANALGVRHAKR